MLFDVVPALSVLLDAPKIAEGMMKYSKAAVDFGGGIPAKIQKNPAPNSRSAFTPILHVFVPGTKVLT